MVPFYFCCNYAIVGHEGTQIFNFIFLSLIIAPYNVLFPHISKIHLPIVSFNLRGHELN